MYGMPKDIDWSPVIGEFTTQLRVGQFDLQCSFGPYEFAVQSRVRVFRDGALVATWAAGVWPEQGFYDVMNAAVLSCEVVSDRLLVITLENGLALHIDDDSEQYVSMTIRVPGHPLVVV